MNPKPYQLLAIFLTVSTFLPGLAFSKTENLAHTLKFTRMVNEELQAATKDKTYQRYFILVSDWDQIELYHKKTRADGDEVCQSLSLQQIEANVQKILREQGLGLRLRPEKAFIAEWQNYFSQQPLQICESVAFFEGVSTHRYWHAYLIENGRRRKSQRMLLLFETVW